MFLVHVWSRLKMSVNIWSQLWQNVGSNKVSKAGGSMEVSQ